MYVLLYFIHIPSMSLSQKIKCLRSARHLGICQEKIMWLNVLTFVTETISHLEIRMDPKSLYFWNLTTIIFVLLKLCPSVSAVRPHWSTSGSSCASWLKRTSPHPDNSGHSRKALQGAWAPAAISTPQSLSWVWIFITWPHNHRLSGVCVTA